MKIMEEIMGDQNEILNAIRNGKKADEILSSEKDKAVSQTATAFDNVLKQVKDCAQKNDLNGIRVLLSSHEQETDRDDANKTAEEIAGEAGEKVDKEADEEEHADDKKTELSNEQQRIDNIRSEIDESFKEIQLNMEKQNKTKANKLKSLLSDMRSRVNDLEKALN
jgi:hypothetical protein